MLDGTVVTQGFTPIGSTGYGVARVPLSTGSHTMTGTSPFGLQVYRYAAHTSYLYPGGLDLEASGCQDLTCDISGPPATQCSPKIASCLVPAQPMVNDNSVEDTVGSSIPR